MNHTLSITFADPDRGIQYQATAYGLVWEGRPARGPSYSSGGEPAEPAGCEVEKIEIDCAAVDGKPSKSKWAMELKCDINDECYAGWCEEVLEDCRIVIEREFMEAASEEEESNRAMAEERAYEAERERRWPDSTG